MRAHDGRHAINEHCASAGRSDCAVSSDECADGGAGLVPVSGYGVGGGADAGGGCGG